MAAPDQILIDADRLSAMLGDPRLVLLDVRWRLDAPDGRPAHREGHLPAAVYVDLDREPAIRRIFQTT